MSTNSKIMNEFLLGFNGLESFLYPETEVRGQFPPHNIVKLSDTEFLVELAIAGYTEDDISVIQEKNELIITGQRPGDIRTYVHHGISSRKFTKKFYFALCFGLLYCN